jgi:hypothetical protein
MTTPRFCEACGEALSTTAKFCPSCGVPIGGGAAAPTVAPAAAQPAARTPLMRALPILLPVIAIAAVLGLAMATRDPAPPVPTAIANDGTGGTAPDISALTPEERVDRLFNRVMALASAGRTDSVQFFAPMAVNAFGAIAPLDLHRRYDLGLVYLVAGEPLLARAQADTILAAQAKHLLGLALAMRAAGAAGDAAARARFATDFRAQLPRERAKQLPEYVDHAQDLDEALAEAEGRAPATAAPSGPPAR